MKAVLAAAAAFLLAACLEDAPRIDPGNVYDANLAVRDAHFQGLDSVRILLVDARDTSRKILVYSGKPDAPGNLPPYHAEAGRSYYFLVEGFAAGRGLCRLETLGPGPARVAHDTCRVDPGRAVVGLQDTLLVVADFPRSPILRLYRLGNAPDTLGIDLIPSVNWLRPARARLTLADLVTQGAVELMIDWDLVPHGPADASIQVRAGGTLQGEAHVAIRGALARTSILGGDTVLLGPFANSWSGTVILPDLPPGTLWGLRVAYPTLPGEFIGINDAFIDGVPQREFNSYVGPPGARRKITLTFHLDAHSKAHAGEVGRLMAVELARNLILDTLHFTFDTGPPFSVSGLYAERGAVSKSGMEVLLDEGRARTRTDTAGYFRFLGVGPGPHLVTMNLPDRFTPAQPIVMDEQGWTALVYPRAGNPLVFKPVILGSPRTRLGPVGPFDTRTVIVIWTPEEGHVLLKGHPWWPHMLEGRLALEIPGFGEETADNLPRAMAGVPGLMYLAYPETRRLAIYPLWEGATNPRLLDLPFAPLALHLMPDHLAVAGVDSAGGLVLWDFTGDESAPIRTFPLGVEWDSDAGWEAGSGIRIRPLPLAGTGLDSAAVPFYQVFVPGKGQSPGKLVCLRPHPDAPPARSVDIGGAPAVFKDGLMAFGSPGSRGLSHYDGNLTRRDSIPFAGPVRAFVQLGEGSSGRGHIVVADGNGNLRFLECATGGERGAVPVPLGAEVRDLLHFSNQDFLTLVADSGVWILDF